MAYNQLTVLNDLPKFSGNSRSHEVNFVQGINVKTFIRTLDNYFVQHQVTDDARKLQILFAQIDKEKGDAIDLVTCYAGKQISYDDVTKDFIQMYPNFCSTEFKHATKTLLESDINKPTTFSGMTRLENQTQAVAEAYLTKEAMIELGITANSKINIESEQGSDSEDDEDNSAITVLSLLQNYTMHLLMSNQLSCKTYDKVSKITPVTAPTRFMSLAVQAAEKQRLFDRDESKKRGKPETNAVIFSLNNQQRNQTRGNHHQKIRKDEREATHQPQPNQGFSRACFKCGMDNHIKRDCRVDTYCSFCRIKGHTLKVCRKKKAQGKYCKNCNIKDSHDTSECYVKNKTNDRTKKQRVNMMNEVDMEDPNQEYEPEQGVSNADWDQE